MKFAVGLVSFLVSILIDTATSATCSRPLLYRGAPIPSNWNAATCGVTPNTCNSTYPWRSYDGSCNNLKHTTWAQVNTAHIRQCDARYSDNVHKVPLAQNGSPLPNSRELSAALYPDLNIPNFQWTLLLVAIVQFVTHDMVRTSGAFAIPEIKGGGCCNGKTSDTCTNTAVAKDDCFYGQYKVSCFSLLRSQYGQTDVCGGTGPAQQINAVSAYIDGSQIYGTDQGTADSLRENQGGRLRTYVTPAGTQLLPITTDGSNANCVPGPNITCAQAGDMVRVNQNPLLLVSQNMFMRWHNKIADYLSGCYGNVDDEVLYQDARHILVAMYQKMVFKDLVPDILTGQVPASLQTYQGYNQEIPVMMQNEFVTATYRVFHSTIQGQMALFNDLNLPSSTFYLSDEMASANLVYAPGNYDQLIRTMFLQVMQDVDIWFTKQTNGLMFKEVFQQKYGLDLGFMDIERGRDHGLASYTTVLKSYRGIVINNFNDLWLKGVISIFNVIQLQKYYASVHDIDLYVGAVYEIRPLTQLFPTTFGVFAAEQFYRARNGDRFYYENPNQPWPLTAAELDQISVFNMASLICATGDDVTEVTPDPFVPWNPLTNPLVKCSDVAQPDLSVFCPAKK